MPFHGDLDRMKTRLKLVTTTAIASGLTLGLALGVAPAAAQEAEQPSTYLGTVILGYSPDGTPIYAGDNTSHMEGNAVTAQGGTARIDDVLRQVPGVSTRLDAGQPGVAVSIRGFQGQGRVAMQVEGVPQNFRFNGHASEGYTYVEPFFLSGIDITRGAAVTAGGSGLAGSVNFRLLKAEDIVAPGKTSGGIVRLSYGDNGDDFRRMIGYGVVDGAVSFMGAIARNTADAYEDGNNVEVTNTDRDTDAYMLRGEYRIDEAQSFEILATRNTYEFAANSYYQDLTADMFKLGYRYQGGDLVDLRANAYVNRIENEYTGSLTGTGSYVGRQQKTTTTGVDVTNVSRLSFGGWDLASTNGFEYVKDKLGGEAGGANPTEGDSKRLSIFTENVFTNGPWELTAGARFSRYKLSGYFDGGGTFDPGEVDIDETSFDPKLTLAYRVNDWLQPYASVYRTTRAPTLQETLQDSYHGYGFFNLYLGSNPYLVPEESTGGEIGVNIDRRGLFQSDDRLTARIAYFKMDVDDYIAYRLESVGPATQKAYYANMPGTTTSKGLEIEATYETARLSVALSYAKSDTTPPGEYEGYQLQPGETYSATIMGRFLDGKLGVGTTYTHTGGGDAIDTEAYSGSYGLWDIFARYDVTENFVITGKISNIEDVTYLPWAASANGMGRTAYIGAEIRF